MTLLAAAVRQEAPLTLDEAYGRQTRAEWAASRHGEGWSLSIVREATGAGALSRVRAAIDEPPKGPSRLLRAVAALAVIESGQHVETRYPTLNTIQTIAGYAAPRAALSPVRRR